MKPIAAADRRIANIHDAAFTPFVYPDGVALGDAVLQLDQDQPLGTGFHVYRMPAGMTTRGHRHNGHEQFLILEGELHESDGTILRKGDLVFYRDGSEHNSHTPNGCLLAVHIVGPETSVE
ncbi:MAG: RmlC-type cupin domain-containing protein [Rhodobacteraceae bacterium]|uniref:cupin domain-containing protein n=1 Tax=Cypionkella sp. TaxID=2811411 RepID=UPI00132661C9|nr:cupin domain-containing protein [Cypionkella sp.]KAF0176192.1 MAG: RmlC-type cupin domain-containing protein [Paracoccaceae bacterium]MDO8328638.1 cupin domain-containing protein [Cypionkella sp.]